MSEIKGVESIFDSIVVIENYPLEILFNNENGKIKGHGKSTFAKTNYDLSLVVTTTHNVEFRFGDIENLPVEDESIDVIISNCVINLAPDKIKVFKESYRVLKQTGRMYVSDIVLLEELNEEQRKDEQLIASCVGGALLKQDYLQVVKDAGFKYNILDEDKEISKTQYQGFNLESLKLELYK